MPRHDFFVRVVFLLLAFLREILQKGAQICPNSIKPIDLLEGQNSRPLDLCHKTVESEILAIAEIFPDGFLCPAVAAHAP